VSRHVTIRMYNVGFGDCFLLTIPAGDRDRTILIDCGRHVGTKMSKPDFWEVVKRLIADLPSKDGHPFIDVIVMTHRHRDHVHGFSRPELWEDVRVGEIWMPWTEAPDDPTARRLRVQQQHAAERALHALRAFGAQDGDPALGLALNSLANEAAMETLAGFGCPIRYLPDALKPQATEIVGSDDRDHGIPRGVRVHVLGPSRDRKVIASLNPPQGAAYLRLVRQGVDRLDGPDGPQYGPRQGSPSPWGGRWDLGRTPKSDAEQCARLGITPKQFVDLLGSVDRASMSDAESLAFSVDSMLNGTSLVLLFEVDGLGLLFPGDAQWGTWKAILGNEAWRAKLDDVRFLKVGHHGSHNATPVEFVEHHLHDAVAMVSVSKTGYTASGWTQIPKAELLRAMQRPGRADLLIRSDSDPPPSDAISHDPDDMWTEVHLDPEHRP